MVALNSSNAAVLGEISSQRLRPYTAGFALGVSCVIGIIMDVLVPYMVNANQWNWSFKTGWFYVGLGSISTVGMWFLMPETKGFVFPNAYVKLCQILLIFNRPDGPSPRLMSCSSGRSRRGDLPKPKLPHSACSKPKTLPWSPESVRVHDLDTISPNPLLIIKNVRVSFVFM